MKHPITQLLKRFGGYQVASDAIGAPLANVQKWAQHGRIPAKYLAPTWRACQDRGWTEITPQWLIEAHEVKK